MSKEGKGIQIRTVDLEKGRHGVQDVSSGGNTDSRDISSSLLDDDKSSSRRSNTSPQPSLIDWDGPDPSNPMNWPRTRKVPAVLSICCLAFSTSFSSSIFAPAAGPVAQEFSVSQTVANLGVSLFVLGFAAGPLLWGPLSEALGRKRPLCMALLLFTTFQIPVAVAQNVPTILVSRFTGGAAGSAAFSIPPAMVVDFLTPAQRLFCINFYMTFTFLLITTIYSSLVYGLLYLLFFSMPWSFTHTRHWTPTQASLPFLAVLLGVLMGSAATAIGDVTWWLRRFLSRGRQIHPEDRLPPLMASGLLLLAGLFWFSWTSTSDRVPWPAQVAAAVPIGAGVVLNLSATTAYVIDLYGSRDAANSAVAAYVSVRSAAAFAFSLFALQMFRRLGPAWAASLLAFCCLALAPAPFLFWRFGERIRGWSR